MRPKRAIAIDWSGAKKGAARKIWWCEVAGGRVRRLECGRDRSRIERELIREATRGPNFVVGLDFAFSLPAAFLAKRGHREIDDVWLEVEKRGEEWIAECPFPFWGRAGTRMPRLGNSIFRRTELAIIEATGLRPKSPFQIAGAGAVGIGSLRGMPLLRRLRQQGFSVWPFDRSDFLLVVEIWPRLFTGPVKKKDREARRRLLEERYPQLDAESMESAVASDDAFDALVSALEMDRHLDEFPRLPLAADAETALEGRIWRPG